MHGWKEIKANYGAVFRCIYFCGVAYRLAEEQQTGKNLSLSSTMQLTKQNRKTNCTVCVVIVGCAMVTRAKE